MATLHNLGFPRIGAKRELKFALEDYWRGETTAEELETTTSALRRQTLALQRDAGLDWIPVGDFSLYDHVLDTSFMLGHLPERFHGDHLPALDQYFRVARGQAPTGEPVTAAEMTKWFDTNYHYIVPELDDNTVFTLNPDRLLEEARTARELGVPFKPVVLGPVSYLYLSKCKTGSKRQLDFLESLIAAYRSLLGELRQHTLADWVQIDEPVLALDLSHEWQTAVERAYECLGEPADRPNILLASYFGPLRDNLRFVTRLPVEGLHIDAVRAPGEVEDAATRWPRQRILSLGVIDGRNVWRSDLNALIDWLEPIHQRRGDRLWLAPSCSLLHVPVTLASEDQLDAELRSWLSFATEKLDELVTIGRALNHGREAVAETLAVNAETVQRRQDAARRSEGGVQTELTADMFHRISPYTARAPAQSSRFRLPLFPTTTIGSFPQTADIRRMRSQYRRGDVTAAEYERFMKSQIALAIQEQEAVDLDVLAHGEAERNDMVEYFGEQLSGYAFTRFGWVQSFGSRCVKPPIIHSDVSRPAPMTVDWTSYAQSLTHRPVKGMLTGPVTMLQWAFVRDDQPRRETALQIALALRREVADLETAGIGMIQVDEPAFREGLPLRQEDQADYLEWAVNAFRLATSAVRDDTQIHTHMCYSEFNDIMESIAALDADVITIETSRSDMELLDAFEDFEYPNEIGPGVYDIHSPNIPEQVAMEALIQEAARRIPPERLWVNPDCGLKTRDWDDVRPALERMVAAARALRRQRMDRHAAGG